MKYLFFALILSACAPVTSQQKRKFEDDAYKACKVVVQVHEAFPEAGTAGE